MVITIKRNSYTPVSLTEVFTVKGKYLKQYSPFFVRVGRFFKHQFKNSAFYSFWLIGTADVD
jgi:hypothetical protein